MYVCMYAYKRTCIYVYSVKIIGGWEVRPSITLCISAALIVHILACSHNINACMQQDNNKILYLNLFQSEIPTVNIYYVL